MIAAYGMSPFLTPERFLREPKPIEIAPAHPIPTPIQEALALAAKRPWMPTLEELERLLVAYCEWVVAHERRGVARTSEEVALADEMARALERAGRTPMHLAPASPPPAWAIRIHRGGETVWLADGDPSPRRSARKTFPTIDLARGAAWAIRTAIADMSGEYRVVIVRVGTRKAAHAAHAKASS